MKTCPKCYYEIKKGDTCPKCKNILEVKKHSGNLLTNTNDSDKLILGDKTIEEKRKEDENYQQNNLNE